MALIELDEAATQANIKVIGIGGGGGNAINTMIASGLEALSLLQQTRTCRRWKVI